MAVHSNGASLKEWSHADAIKAITLWSLAGPGTRHLRRYAAGSGRKATMVDLTCDTEESQGEENNGTHYDVEEREKERERGSSLRRQCLASPTADIL